MVLSDEDIAHLCVGRPEEWLVNPFSHDLLKPASYDLLLGSTFIRFPNDSRDSVIDLADPAAGGERVQLSVGESLVLEPGEFALAETHEWVNIPNGIVARVEGKSTTGRSGLLVHVTAGYIDPGFKGRITLEVCALRRSKLRLTPGQKIAQLSFLRMTAPARHPYNGRYQNAAGPEAVKAEVPYGFATGGVVKGPVAVVGEGPPDRIIRSDGMAEEVHVFDGKPHVVVPGGGSFEVHLEVEGQEFGTFDQRRSDQQLARHRLELTGEARDRSDIQSPVAGLDYPDDKWYPTRRWDSR